MTTPSVRPARRPDAAATPTAPASVATGRATGKAILIGEHAVVYGRPAIALPLAALAVQATATRTEGPSRIRSALFSGRLDAVPARLLPTAKAITATLDALGHPHLGVDLQIQSEIPAERGVGSSAAVAAAVVRAVAALVGATLSGDEEHALIQQAERVAHTAPSGLDSHAVRARGPLWFGNGVVEPVAVGRPLSLIVADTGVAGRTREAVAGVAERRRTDPAVVDAAIDRLGALTDDARTLLAAGDLDGLGAVMTRAHELLGGLGVGDPALDRLVAAATRAGALGAKLTGGGRGGCALILVRDLDHAADVAGSLRAAGAAATWTTTVEATP